MRGDPRRNRHDEYVPEDDAVIGRVFRRSLIAIIVVGATVALVRLLWVHAPEPESVDEAEPLRPQVQRVAAQPPAVRFTDVTREAGISFVHENGARGAKLMPETMGSGAAFFDYDGDDDPDLLLVNATHWPGDPVDDAKPPPTLALYRNDGRGHFEDVTRQAGLDVSLYGAGVAVGDYDADGDRDLFITAVGPNRLFRNESGRFIDVTESAGVAGGSSDWGTSAGFFDADNDGDLDLFVCNYVEWSPEIDRAVAFQITGIGRAYGPPRGFRGAHSSLLRNRGDGRFVDVSREAGLHIESAGGAPVAKALALAFADLDADGWTDVIVANDTAQNFVFHNRGDGTFDEKGVEIGLAFDSNGAATGAMGIDVAHYRNDDEIGVAIGNFANEMSSLFVGRFGGLVYSDEAIVEGIGPESRATLTFGLFFFDYDLDGRLDLLQANGHLEEEIAILQSSQRYRQPAQLFWNAGPNAEKTFAPVSPASTGDLARPIVGRAATYSDIDADGDLDVLLTQVAGAPLLLRNDQALGHHWLRVVLEGVGGNRDALGARLELRAGEQVQHRFATFTRSYQSQVEKPLTFGLGEATRVDRLEVQWPDGSRSVLVDVPVDQTLHVRQASD
jgi:hypothetical protein